MAISDKDKREFLRKLSQWTYFRCGAMRTRVVQRLLSGDKNLTEQQLQLLRFMKAIMDRADFPILHENLTKLLKNADSWERYVKEYNLLSEN